jgi:hypothetical protein
MPRAVVTITSLCRIAMGVVSVGAFLGIGQQTGQAALAMAQALARQATAAATLRAYKADLARV